jgi:chorismate synthase
MSNAIGKLFTFTSFGESHGKGIGGIIDGCPPGIEIDALYIQSGRRNGFRRKCSAFDGQRRQ